MSGALSRRSGGGRFSPSMLAWLVRPVQMQVQMSPVRAPKAMMVAWALFWDAEGGQM